jgi:hypothetical protein
VEVEPLLRALYEVQMRVYGAEHPNALKTAGGLAWSLSTNASTLMLNG